MGQNLFAVSGDAFNVTAAITESWYKNELPPMNPYFGSANIPSDVFHNVGHLTQLLWKGTTSVGCVSKQCDNMQNSDGTPTTMKMYTVCNYWPPGNYPDQYAANIDSPNSQNFGSWSD